MAKTKSQPEYPEHEKLTKVHEESQAIGSFLDWLGSERGYVICEYTDTDEQDEGYDGMQVVRIRQSIQDLLAEYFEIDLNVLEREKRHMLNTMRKSHATR